MAARAEALHSTSQRTPVFAYWHLLSLDAPTVAMVWCCAFAQCAGVQLPTAVPLALAASAWALYAADRLLDVRRARDGAGLRERHWFHARHRRAFFSLLVVAPFFLGWVAAAQIPARILHCELLVAVAAGLYFAAVHLGPLPLPAKEIVVGCIFAFAVAAPTLAGPHPATIWAAVACFAMLCTLNCLVIERCERGLNCTTAARLLFALIIAAALLAIVLPRMRLLLLAIACSAALLLAMVQVRAQAPRLLFRVAADAALLTPLFVVAPQLLR